MNANNILIDSSFLYALFNPAVKQHQQTVAFIKRDRSSLLLPQVVLTEVSYLMWMRATQQDIETFLSAIASAQFDLISVLPEDIEQVKTIRAKYQTVNFDFVDCCLMALSERLNITRICTYDRRDFSIYRPKHCEFLDLEP